MYFCLLSKSHCRSTEKSKACCLYFYTFVICPLRIHLTKCSFIDLIFEDEVIAVSVEIDSELSETEGYVSVSPSAVASLGCEPCVIFMFTVLIKID